MSNPSDSGYQAALAAAISGARKFPLSLHFVYSWRSTLTFALSVSSGRFCRTQLDRIRSVLLVRCSRLLFSTSGLAPIYFFQAWMCTHLLVHHLYSTRATTQQKLKRSQITARDFWYKSKLIGHRSRPYRSLLCKEILVLQKFWKSTRFAHVFTIPNLKQNAANVRKFHGRFGNWKFCWNDR